MDIPREKRNRTKQRIFLGAIAVLLVAGTAYGLSRLSPAAPTVEKGSVWTDTVKRGPMLREVRGTGTLVPEDVRFISAVTDGVVERLESGALVADVGCGAGVALTALAEAYPNSSFHGYELSDYALDRAAQRVAALELDNVTLHPERAEHVPDDGRYDLVLTFDCLHDMTRPAEALAAIRKTVRDDGTLLIKDIRCTGSWDTDRQNPMLAMFYGFSITSCMSSALSEPGGAGLGTVGFGTTVAEQMVRDAGFGRFTPHDFDDPANLYYEVRP